MATAQVVTSLKHDNTVYNVRDEIEADKSVLDNLAQAGVVQKVKGTPEPKQEQAPAKAEAEAEKIKKAAQTK